MSKEIILQLFSIVDSNDWESLQEVFCNDIVYERPGYSPFVGYSSLVHFYKNERIIASGKHYLERIVVEDNYGACWGTFVGEKKDGANVREQFADIYTFEDGYIKQRRTYFFRSAI